MRNTVTENMYCTINLSKNIYMERFVIADCGEKMKKTMKGKWEDIGNGIVGTREMAHGGTGNRIFAEGPGKPSSKLPPAN
jgi:hypothetical protein